jgi:hypothetical protein
VFQDLPVVLATIWSSASIFGQVAPDGIVALVGNMGIMGVLVWHLWYHTTHSYPRMLDTFTKELGHMREAFVSEQNATRSFHDRQSTELRSMLIQNMNSMRTAVHDIKDTAQAVVSRQDLAKMDKDT